MKVLVINAGSSSIKYQLFDMPSQKVVAKGIVEKIGESVSRLSHFYGDKVHNLETKVTNHEQGMKFILQTLISNEVGVIKNISEIGAVGHRVVHGKSVV